MDLNYANTARDKNGISHDPKGFYTSQNGIDNSEIFAQNNNWVKNIFFYNSTSSVMSWSLSVQYTSSDRSSSANGGGVSFNPSQGSIPAHVDTLDEAVQSGYGTHIIVSNDNVNFPPNSEFGADVFLTVNNDPATRVQLYHLSIKIIPQPKVTSVTSDTASNTVTIKGENLDNPSIRVGKTVISDNDIKSSSDSSITVAIPPGQGTADVYVEYPNKCLSDRYSDAKCVSIKAGTITYSSANKPDQPATPTLEPQPTPTPTPEPQPTPTPEQGGQPAAQGTPSS